MPMPTLKLPRHYLRYGGGIALVLVMVIWFAWFRPSDPLLEVVDRELPAAVIGSADIVPLSSVHESLVEIEGNYRGYAKHLLHLMETDQVGVHYAQAMQISVRMQETTEQALEFAQDVKKTLLLRNSAAQAFLVLAADAYILRAQEWGEQTRYLIRLAEEMRAMPPRTPEERQRYSSRFFPQKDTKVSKSPSKEESVGQSRYFAVERHLISAYRALGYQQSEINFNRGGLLIP